MKNISISEERRYMKALVEKSRQLDGHFLLEDEGWNQASYLNRLLALVGEDYEQPIELQWEVFFEVHGQKLMKMLSLWAFDADFIDGHRLAIYASEDPAGKARFTFEFLEMAMEIGMESIDEIELRYAEKPFQKGDRKAKSIMVCLEDDGEDGPFIIEAADGKSMIEPSAAWCKENLPFGAKEPQDKLYQTAKFQDVQFNGESLFVRELLQAIEDNGLRNPFKIQISDVAGHVRREAWVFDVEKDDFKNNASQLIVYACMDKPQETEYSAELFNKIKATRLNDVLLVFGKDADDAKTAIDRAGPFAYNRAVIKLNQQTGDFNFVVQVD